ncbi:TPA: helix-turn-helix domain-containing protein [Pseudomonas aeruginosa]|uniref:helix-turn-helix domain-containing protein n=1 Tax=Pseudomonas aeruginosa TaxID=287 RepID=UPI00070F930E|nr:helix-turn-helix domain-containing protein [Pseudomonas aeruginosa]EJB8386779.1 helix-turn-helix domain-containing protein [Pseudomonas aeruginosa]MBV5795578.1 helix-turn-helix domain-containing protein [Pseudomonas aeruginosa]MCV3846787.1 helix-turn-helix domain-containing protein [Pseudomonas aeruginosa]MCV3852822.1 helix-turn-helix domain-containing protein [Pseudomonas aeruginosa]MDU0742995.1 helix-turn-helix domain-containing protein [Pseudomonas aeruginosa]
MEKSVTVKSSSFHSCNPEEVSEFIERIYADNKFRAQSSERKDVIMFGQSWRGIGIYDVDYEMPFKFLSEGGRPNYLFLSCVRGGACYSSDDGSHSQCSVGDVIPISPGGRSDCVTKPEGFGHLSVIIDSSDLNEFVTLWTGKELSEPVQFDLKSVSGGKQWVAAADCLRRMMLMSPMPYEAASALYEYMLKLIVTSHSSNYDELIGSDRCENDRIAQSALAKIKDNPMLWMTLSSIASALGCATCWLENAILRLTGKSSISLFEESRLDHARFALLTDEGRTMVDIFHSYGFVVSNRLFLLYQQRFGESPIDTYRRNPNSASDETAFKNIKGVLCDKELIEFIDARIGEKISLSDLANFLGLSEYAAIKVFKERFACTPMNYINERRLEKARFLLCFTKESIVSIALRCGFGSQSYLTTQLKRRYGVTPRKLRIQSGGD